MLAVAFAFTLLLVPAVNRSQLPTAASQRGLMELTRDGEVMYLPVHDRRPFNALLVTRANMRCPAVEKAMFDVEQWPKLFNVKEVKVTERLPTKVTYEMKLGIALAPLIRGSVERPEPGRITFHDPETNADFKWSFIDDEFGCHMVYSLVESAEKQSAFVAVVRSVEKGGSDSANFAAALGSARGYAKPETDRLSPRTMTTEGEAAWTALASHGSGIRVIRAAGRWPRIVVRRRVDQAPEQVLARIRDRDSYDDKVDIVKDARTDVGQVHWSFGYFGGRVNLDTRSVENGSLAGPEGVRIEERVMGGDLKAGAGSWAWTVRRIDGGSDVELVYDLNLVPGSSIMSALAQQDAIMGEALALHVAIALAHDVYGGKPLSSRALATAH